MGVEPPFLYDPPSRLATSSSDFNPKRISQASLRPPSPREKQTTPLMNFNQHPDSFPVLPYGNTNARPMGAKTKDKVRWARAVLLGFRVVQLISATALFVAAICIRSIDTTDGWFVRIPAGVATIHCIYAIYHLSRRPNDRTPASSAGYMLFASAADVSLVTFYAFTGLLSNTQHLKGAQMDWTLVFDDPNLLGRIVWWMVILSFTNAALHVVSLLLSIGLAVVFRKISQLPPDMNPLEANLTCRHKKRDSYVDVSEKVITHSRNESALSSTRASQAPLIPPMRSVPFMHTRTDSTESLAGLGATPPSNRNSRALLPSQVSAHSPERSSAGSLTRSAGARSPPKRSSQHGHKAGGSPSKSSVRSSLLQDNWFTYDEVPTSCAASVVSSLNSTDLRHAAGPADASYEPVDQHLYDDEIKVDREKPLPPHPLELNPPTPPPFQHLKRENPGPLPGPNHQPGLRLGSLNRGGSLKVKLYGELKCATPPIMVGTCVDLPMEAHSQRAVSRSGADVADDRIRGSRGRDVSGKIVEEGRGGLGMGSSPTKSDASSSGHRGWPRLRKGSVV